MGRPRKKLTAKAVVALAVLMGLGAWWQIQRAGAGEDGQGREKDAADMAEGTFADERIALLENSLPECHDALAGFLAAGSPEARNQFVADPISMAGRMAAFYATNPFPRVEVARLSRKGNDAIKVGGEWIILTRWQEGEDGASFDAVFRRESGAWMLDWEHFSQHSEYPWLLFLAGDGPDQGEFRLLAREVTGLGDAVQGGSGLRFELVSPVFGKPSATGGASRGFMAARQSQVALALEEAFAAQQGGVHPLGTRMEPLEPEGLVRVRVLVERKAYGGAFAFEVKQVLANHWLGGDVPGLAPEGHPSGGP